LRYNRLKIVWDQFDPTVFLAEVALEGLSINIIISVINIIYYNTYYNKYYMPVKFHHILA